MKLSTLLEDLVVDFMLPDLDITGLALDSREIKPGNLFFAYPGTIGDGRNYIMQAIEKGAAVILCESEGFLERFKLPSDTKIPIISIQGLRDFVGYLVAKFYNYPSEHMLIIGITGTSGKTSTCQLIAEALQKLGKKAATIGTIGYGIVGEEKIPCATTTPSPIELQKILDGFLKKGVKAVVMEVSSHALDQGRMLGIDFTLGIFTNLSRDHLDYHQTMEAYRDAKRRFFEMPGLKYGVFNLDDPTGKAFISDFQKKLQVCGYSLNPPDKTNIPVVFADHICPSAIGVWADIYSPWGKGKLETTLLGRFNLLNLLAVLGSLCLLGYAFEKVMQVLSESQTVPGRMETFGGGRQPLFVIDYSHKPDPLEKVLSALREHCEGDLYCVFGCGGDRDRGKRPMMAEIVEQYADRIIVTDDNVRTENPDQIFEDISAGFKNKNAVQYEHDRKRAIGLAYSQAKQGDVILLAGKGHEDYQIIGTQKIHLSEKEIVLEILNSKF